MSNLARQVRVPDAVQRERERVRGKRADVSFADCAREWCTADPGPSRARSSAVPGLQRTAASISGTSQNHGPRCAAPGTRDHLLRKWGAGDQPRGFLREALTALIVAAFATAVFAQTPPPQKASPPQAAPPARVTIGFVEIEG